MKGYRFYEELDKDGISRERIIAVSNDISSCSIGYVDCIGSPDIYSSKNGPVYKGTISVEYLVKETREVYEKKARQIHPRLFEYLERED